MIEITADEIVVHINKFTEIYDTEGNEINPFPKGEKLTIYCEGLDIEDSGFVCDVYEHELGLEAFIAKRWIRQSDLDILMK